MNAYITYSIKTKTKSNRLKSSQLIVERRYNDFVWLHDKLFQQYKGVIIPPLPEKGMINRFSPEFIAHRRKKLEKFLRRVVNHYQLQNSDSLKQFLELSEQELLQVKEEPKQKKSFISFVTQSVSTVTNIGTSKEIDPWFDSNRSYFNALDQNIQNILNRSSQLSKKHKEMSQLWTDLALGASLTSTTEVESDKLLSSYWDRLAVTSNQISQLARELGDTQISSFEDNLKDYVRLIEAVKDMLNNRSHLLYVYQSMTKSLEQKKEKTTKNE